jgi:hypothetical protein
MLKAHAPAAAGVAAPLVPVGQNGSMRAAPLTRTHLVPSAPTGKAAASYMAGAHPVPQ